jgi:signal transduction histidine kinase
MIGRLEESLHSTIRFTSDASHELRTPLTIVRGELEALLADETVPEHAGSTLDSLIEETDRLTRIVEGLLALSRLDAGVRNVKHANFDLAELTATTTEQMCLLAVERNISVDINADEPVKMEGEDSRIKQVIVNLLDNAVKYTPEGGRIWVDVRAENERAILEVSDTGPGIREEAIPYVFDRFYRAENVRAGEVEGSGLGLSIVKAICIGHGGSVSASNLPSGGCRIRAEFPLAR